jgi:hypothetical protein
MKIDDMIMISVDDHVVEPPDVFDGRLAAKYIDRAPQIVRKDDGSDVWVFEGRQMPNIGLNTVAGRPPAEYGVEPTAYSQLRPGCYDVKARVDDMNANGVLGSMCFPSFPAFCGQIFYGAQDKELAIAVLRAYNDWHIDEWCGGAPETLMEELVGVPDDEINLITHENAMRLFRYDPFLHIPKDKATVGSLRAQAVDVDLSLKSHGGLRPSDGQEIVTAGQVAMQLATAMTTID